MTWLLKIGAFVKAIPVWLLVGLVRVYQWTLSPLIGRQCRFQPTCSQYALDAINKYGAWKGGWRAFKRILRCRPGGPTGYDPA